MREQKRTNRANTPRNQRYDLAIDRLRRNITANPVEPSKYIHDIRLPGATWSTHKEYHITYPEWRRIYAGGIITLSALCIVAAIVSITVYIGITGVIRWLP